MELVNFEWARCLDGYRLQTPKALNANQGARIRKRRMVNVDPYPNSAYVLPNSSRFGRYRPLKNELFKVLVDWKATPEGRGVLCYFLRQLIVVGQARRHP